MSHGKTITQPILVMMSWRGGARLQRCLESIAPARHYFKRIILSITAPADSEDMRRALAFAGQYRGIEVICTGKELPTMEHQAFWISYLQRTGAEPSDWIYWLAYDDQVRRRGIDAIVDSEGNWPLEPQTAYIGPWAMRHEGDDELWKKDPARPMESWTSFPTQGPLVLPLLQWIAQQIEQPTYMQMSGSVIQVGCYIALRDSFPKKRSPMRIEMATAVAGDAVAVAEFAEPLVIIYGRPNSDRANHGDHTRGQDLNLMALITRKHMGSWLFDPSSKSLTVALKNFIRRRARPGTVTLKEEWRIRQEMILE